MVVIDINLLIDGDMNAESCRMRRELAISGHFGWGGERE